MDIICDQWKAMQELDMSGLARMAVGGTNAGLELFVEA
jgi:hypothetical protein